MHKNILILSLLLSHPSYAFFAKGVYKGQDLEGNPCSFRLGETWFVDEYEHPLTKRIEINQIDFVNTKVKVNHFQASHPSLLNPADARVEINRDVFIDTMATSFGVVAVWLSKEGLQYIEDYFANSKSSIKQSCLR